MSTVLRFSSLSSSDQWLVSQLQDIQFGRLTFVVSAGSASPQRGYRVICSRKLRGTSQPPRLPADRQEFLLRDEQVSLLNFIRRLPDGTRATIKVAAGLPSQAIDLEQDHLPVP